jgi:hypothetical protein
MKRFGLAAIALIAPLGALAPLAIAAPAQAAVKVPFTITEQIDRTTGTTTFTATGPLCQSGTFADDVKVFAPSPGSPGFGTSGGFNLLIHRLHCADGGNDQRCENTASLPSTITASRAPGPSSCERHRRLHRSRSERRGRQRQRQHGCRADLWLRRSELGPWQVTVRRAPTGWPPGPGPCRQARRVGTTGAGSRLFCRLGTAGH